jgi:rubrerythrin
MNDEITRSMTMLSTALEMEEKGKKYYDEAALGCRNPLGREVYDMLARYEIQHVERIQTIYDGLTQGRGWNEDASAFAVVSDLSEAFRALARKHESTKADASDIQAIEVGIEFEDAAIRFYQGQLPQAIGVVEQKFIQAMIAEERGHLNLLTDLKYYYTDPAGWLLEKSRGTLDGA